ncbi:MAG: hypothetical protein M1812_006145 [Candelaria pacifica]|nr:MAG: hypothetical protein M1812_006145 [Candelaria pacifica]
MELVVAVELVQRECVIATARAQRMLSRLDQPAIAERELPMLALARRLLMVGFCLSILTTPIGPTHSLPDFNQRNTEGGATFTLATAVAAGFLGRGGSGNMSSMRGMSFKRTPDPLEPGL